MSIHEKFRVGKAYLDRVVAEPKLVYSVRIESLLVVFYVYDIFSRIGSLPRINFFDVLPCKFIHEVHHFLSHFIQFRCPDSFDSVVLIINKLCKRKQIRPIINMV